MSPAGKKILIADDDASIRLVLSQSFTRLGYQVRATGNASTLLKWVSEGEGDLVITVVMMVYVVVRAQQRKKHRARSALAQKGKSA